MNTPEMKERLRLAKLDKPRAGNPENWKHKEETKKKISKSKRGTKTMENHWNWQGGKTTICLQIRGHFKYRQWRSDVFERDEFVCQKCGAKSGQGKAVFLEAHHLKSFNDILKEYKIKVLEDALNCEELWNINNGLTLCKNCHRIGKFYN